MQLPPSDLISKLPTDLGLGRIALLFQGQGFARQDLLVADAAIPALPFKDAQFQFGHIELTPVARRVMELQAPENPTRFGRRGGFIQSGGPMDVEVVENHAEHLRIRKRLVDQPLHLV